MLRLLILVAVVVGLALWFLKGRGKGTPATPAQRTPGKSAAEKPAPMVACAHCGVHLPRLEASVDAEGRAYCGEAHRVAGPR